MITLSLLLSAGLISAGEGPAAGRASWLWSRHETAIPAWARKYNMNCSGCHYPVVPRLNETGIRFRHGQAERAGDAGVGDPIRSLIGGGSREA